MGSKKVISLGTGKATFQDDVSSLNFDTNT